MTDSLYGSRVSMEPVGIELRYREAESGIQHTVEPDGFVPVEETTLSIEVSFDGEVLEMDVVPAVPLVIEHMQVRLRHAFASGCIALGFDVKTLSEILGHSSVELTLNRYVHSSMDRKRQCMALLDKAA